MSDWSIAKKRVSVRDSAMAYVEFGLPDPTATVVFLHGNPTSSFLWRDVMAEMPGRVRTIAPDLIGMGDSGKLADPSNPDTYGFASHARYLDGFIDAVLGPDQPIVLVIHDWGSALGFDWAFRNPERVLGIAYMEGIVRPLAGWEEWNEQATPVFQGLRSDKGEAMILEKNLFVERILPGSVLRELTEAEMAEYRRPFQEPEDRWPTLTWPRNIPIGGEPPETAARVQAYADWLATSEIPKLFVDAEPGAILIGAQREFCRAWPNQTEIKVKGSHFIQEDSGSQIGRAVVDWMERTGILPPV